MIFPLLSKRSARNTFPQDSLAQFKKQFVESFVLSEVFSESPAGSNGAVGLCFAVAGVGSCLPRKVRVASASGPRAAEASPAARQHGPGESKREKSRSETRLREGRLFLQHLTCDQFLYCQDTPGCRGGGGLIEHFSQGSIIDVERKYFLNQEVLLRCKAAVISFIDHNFSAQLRELRERDKNYS